MSRNISKVHPRRPEIIFFLLLIFPACKSNPYPEKEIAVVVPFTHAPTKSNIVKTAEPKKPIIREDVRQSWSQLERTLKERKLTLLDLASTSSDILQTVKTLETGDPSRLIEKIDSYRRNLGSLKVDRKFVLDKMERTRAILVGKKLSEGEMSGYSQRLEAVPRLLEEEKWSVANEVMTDMQNELEAK